jgi:negative regulator of sigma E activity
MMEQTASNQVSARLTIERISVLLDGEMDRTEAAATIAALCADPALRRHWHELHRAGDALRSHEVAASDAEDFCRRVAAAIGAEPTVLAPRAAKAANLRDSIDGKKFAARPGSCGGRRRTAETAVDDRHGAGSQSVV